MPARAFVFAVEIAMFRIDIDMVGRRAFFDAYNAGLEWIDFIVLALGRLGFGRTSGCIAPRALGRPGSGERP